MLKKITKLSILFEKVVVLTIFVGLWVVAFATVWILSPIEYEDYLAIKQENEALKLGERVAGVTTTTTLDVGTPNIDPDIYLATQSTANKFEMKAEIPPLLLRSTESYPSGNTDEKDFLELAEVRNNSYQTRIYKLSLSGSDDVVDPQIQLDSEGNNALEDSSGNYWLQLQPNQKESIGLEKHAREDFLNLELQIELTDRLELPRV